MSPKKKGWKRKQQVLPLRIKEGRKKRVVGWWVFSASPLQGNINPLPQLENWTGILDTIDGPFFIWLSCNNLPWWHAWWSLTSSNLSNMQRTTGSHNFVGTYFHSPKNFNFFISSLTGLISCQFNFRHKQGITLWILKQFTSLSLKRWTLIMEHVRDGEWIELKICQI